jgi:nicotinic acid mononucleotide adenylyltransferase
MSRALLLAVLMLCSLSREGARVAFADSLSSGGQEAGVVQQQEPVVVFFSGAFDPPTVGHRNLIENALKRLKADRILVEVNVAGSKDYHAGVRERAQMLRSMFAGDPRVKVLEGADVGDTNARSVIQREAPGAKIIHLMGEDSWQKMVQKKWRPYGEVVVVVRPGQRQDPEILRGVRVEDFDEPEVSSTEVRSSIALGKFDPTHLDPRVSEYIRGHRLYVAPKGFALLARKFAFKKAFNRFVATTESLTGTKISKTPAPEFNPDQSVDAWNSKFMKWLSARPGGVQLTQTMFDHGSAEMLCIGNQLETGAR